MLGQIYLLAHRSTGSITSSFCILGSASWNWIPYFTERGVGATANTTGVAIPLASSFLFSLLIGLG